MTMRRTHDIRPRGMHRGMDHIRGCIQQAAGPPVDDLPVVVHEDQIGGLDQGEGHAEWVDPEGGWVDGVPERDVPSDAFVVAELAEDAEGEREAAFQVGALFVLVLESGRGGEVLELHFCGWWGVSEVFRRPSGGFASMWQPPGSSKTGSLGERRRGAVSVPAPGCTHRPV
jgi:hypothetical protein